MTITFDVQHDINKAVRSLNRWQKKAVPKATVNALNKVAKEAQTIARRKLSKVVGLPQKDIKKALVSIKANKNFLQAAVRASGKFLNVIRFKGRQTKKGVVAKPWGTRRLFKGAFIGNRGRTVFVRKGKDRLPIKGVVGPSIPHEFVRDEIPRAMEQTVKTRFPILFGRALEFFASRLR